MSHSPGKLIMACGVLVAGAAVMLRNMWPDWSGNGPTSAVAWNDADAFVGLDEDAAGDRSAEPSDDRIDGGTASSANKRDRLRADLLTLVGSYRSGTPVANPFLTEIGELVARPLVETSLRWDGSNDPPPLTVSLTMLSGAAARAVVDGSVLGIGDQTVAGKLLRIDAAGVEIDAGRHRLYYDFDSPYPREFRDELARRQAAAIEQGDTTNDAAIEATADESVPRASAGQSAPSVPAPPRDPSSPWLQRPANDQGARSPEPTPKTGQQRS